MPTDLPRLQITRTPVVERALAIAERRWPGLPKSEQLTRLVESVVADEDAARAERKVRRKAALQELRGSVHYPPNYLSDLRAGNRE